MLKQSGVLFALIRAEVDAPRAHLFEQAGNARMGVLHVVHRVVVRLLFGKIEVEIKMLFSCPGYVEESRRVHAHFVAQVPQGFKLASAGGHGHAFAAAVQGHELHQPNLQA